MLKIIEKTVKISLNYLKSKFIAKDFNQVKDNCAPEISKRYERVRSARVAKPHTHKNGGNVISRLRGRSL